MNSPVLEYLGPSKKQHELGRGRRFRVLRQIPLGFMLVVALPTIIATIYFLFIATPRYVSEARFLVRSPGQDQPSTLGVALQGVGLSSGSSNAFAVHEYVISRDSLKDLSQIVDVRRAYGHGGIDVLSRVPWLFGRGSDTDLYKGFQNYVSVGYESSSGISTLRVQAFSPADAQRINEGLLLGGEKLLNRLNRRASEDAVMEAGQTLREAQDRLNSAQRALTDFRNREGVIDPGKTALASSQLIGELSLNLATLNAERAQVAATAPASPQLPYLDGRIRALKDQIAIAEAKLTGEADSLAPKISAYEDLSLEKEFADRMVASATASLNSARLEARRQQLYLDRIVEPNLPDSSEEPKRWLMILTIFVSLLIIYMIGWLGVASVRESRDH